jgi:hypothetical protein
MAGPYPHADTQTGPTPAAQPASRWHDSSRDEYRQHLTDLTALVEACAKAREKKACDPVLVGPDDRVSVGASPGAEQRLVRYGWLRVLLSTAEEKDEPQPQQKPAKQADASQEATLPPRRTTPQLLGDAQVRLAADLAQAGRASAPAPNHSQERDAMKQVLAGRDFRNLEKPSARDAILERIGNWLNRIFASAARLRARSAWIGRLIVWGFVLFVFVGLVWGLLQMERRWRIRLVPEGDAPAAGVASARDWQLWLGDASKAATAGQWRVAIHCVYWASISRLESRRLWPADRARTPREYLAIVSADDPRKAGLARLTGSFERTWYGGRLAAESDYRTAEELAAGLISGSSATAAAGESAK